MSDERRVLAGRIGRLRSYLKAAIDAGDWSIVDNALRDLRAEEAAMGLLGAPPAADEEARLHNLERAFAAILAGLMQPQGQKHPHYDALLQDKPIRFVIGVSRDGKLVVNFEPVDHQ